LLGPEIAEGMATEMHIGKDTAGATRPGDLECPMPVIPGAEYQISIGGMDRPPCGSIWLFEAM